MVILENDLNLSGESNFSRQLFAKQKLAQNYYLTYIFPVLMSSLIIANQKLRLRFIEMDFETFTKNIKENLLIVDI